MMKARIYTLSLVLFSSVCCIGQPYATWSRDELKLNNGVVERRIKLPGEEGNFITTKYQPVKGEFYYFKPVSPDFQFEVDGTVYSGTGKWTLKEITKHADALQGDGASLILTSADKKIELTIQYLLYPRLPVIRKNLIIRNLTAQTQMIESVDVEKLDASDFSSTTYSWICHDYGRRRSIGQYDGNLQDALIIVHNSNWMQGIVIGNEAAGAVKHSSVFWNEPYISTGLTHKDARYPFRKFLAGGESFTTPQVFTMVYNDHKDPAEILNTAIPDFVREHLGIRLSKLTKKPTFVYNTWVPFAKNINEKLVLELAKSAAAAGMKEFIIDDGWQENYGDWVIDKKKFPNGLKPVFDYIKSLGMKPGLWVSVGSAASTSNVFKSHPEWFVRDEQQQFFNLHINDQSMRTACFGTGWYDYIKGILSTLSLEYGLEYLKLDFTVVTSPYRFNDKETGCYATDHAGHKDHRESLYSNYEQVWKLFDELHVAKPDLFIDCTFETMGALQLIDYAMLKHAEGNWLSNFEGEEKNVDLRVRNMAWWRSPAISATALVIGNPAMEDRNWDLHIKSLAGALPIMLGDPRKLSAPDFTRYRSFADWLQRMENRYQIMSYRQDLPGFGEPADGMWDGYERINTNTKSGGIVGVFRQGARETKRQVTVKYLDAVKLYTVKRMDGKTITEQTGKELSEKGFEVTLNKFYDGEMFEISGKK